MEQDGLTRYCKIDQDYCLERLSKMVLQDIARLTKIFVWKDGLTRFCKIDQGYLSSNIKKIYQEYFLEFF